MCRRLSVCFVVVVLISSVSSRTAHADPVKCLAGIGKNGAAFAQAKMKILQKCEEGRFKGKITTTCQGDQKTQDAITKAQSKTAAAIAKTCAGKDKTCGTGDDDSTAWDASTCQGFEAQGCTSAVTNCNDIGPCLTCIGEKAVDQAINVYYGGLQHSDPKTQKDLNKCQLAIGKSAAAFFAAKSKALQKCWDTVNKNAAKGESVEACPPFGLGDGKAVDAINKAASKKDATICKACGGKDKLCNTADDVITPADIGITGQCLPVTIPNGGTACGSITMATLQDIVNCIDCVTEFKADCIAIAAARGFPQDPGYPTECAAALPATPTPTSTPVLSATATTTGAVTPTATQTVSGGGPTTTATQTAAGPTATVTATHTASAPTATATQTVSAPTTTATPAPGCPTRITFTGTSTGAVLDSGWTGLGHDATVVTDGTITVGVTSCAGTAGSCGQCNIVGPVDNVSADAGEIANHRCTGDTRIKCSTTADCSGTHCLSGSNDGATCTTASQCPGGSCLSAGTCEYYFGTYLPLAAGGVATCVGNQVSGTITGTADVTTGGAASHVQLISRVSTGPNPNPCPKCVGDTTPNDGNRGGTCDVGPNAGLSCDVNGSSINLFWGSTSLDCPPNSASVIAALPINLTNSTGTETRTVSAANPSCTAPGFGTLKCLCSTCNDLAAEPCSSNADCTGAGNVCGGRRCVGGTNNGNACSLTCTGGANVGAPCTVTSQCPGSACTSNSQCAGGGACTVPGQATKPNDCSDGMCSPTNTCVGGSNHDLSCSAASDCPGGTCTAGNDGECDGGPFEQYCAPNATFQGCGTNADCASSNACVGGSNAGGACSGASSCPGGTCQSKVGGTAEACTIGKFRPCFLDNGTIGNTVNATGHVDVPVSHQSNPTLASLFCIGPTSSGSVNGAAGLPGLGRLELQGHATDNGTP